MNYKDTIEKIKSNPVIQQLIKEHNLSEEQIENNLMIFLNIIEEQNNPNFNWKTTIEIIDNNKIIEKIIPIGENKNKIKSRNFLPLNYITNVPLNLSFAKNLKVGSDLSESDFFWVLENQNNRQKIKVALENNAILWKEKKEAKGFFIHGSFGTGKTRFLKTLANYFVNKDKVVAFINVNDLFSTLTSDFDENHKIIKIMKESEILMIDDLGSTKPSDWFEFRVLFNILNDRSSKNKLTFFSSNYTIKGLERYYKKDLENSRMLRLIDRIKHLSIEVPLDGNNLK